MSSLSCKAVASSAPATPSLEIKLAPDHAFTRGVGISASSGPVRVALHSPDRSTARSIIRSWEALVSLNQNLRCNDSREAVRVFRDLACAFGAEVTQDIDGLPGAMQPTISRLELPQTESCVEGAAVRETFSWTHIERPNKGAIEWIAQQTGFKPSSLEQYLADSSQCRDLKSSKCSITRTYELSLPHKEDEFGKLSAKLCTVICGDNFLITVSREPMAEVQGVWSDLEKRCFRPEQCCSSTAVARLIVKETLGQYQRTVEELNRRIDKFWQSHSSHAPGPADLLKPQAMRTDIRTGEHFALGFDNTMYELEQRESPTDRAASELLRENVSRTIAEVNRSLDRCDQDVRDGESSWASVRDQLRNSVLFKLAVATALSVPLGVAAGIGGMNFGNPLPDWLLWGGLAGSVLVSVGLVGGLFLGKNSFFNFRSRPPENIHSES
jgi:Mg2+ and Co2+ transporter CorA